MRMWPIAVLPDLIQNAVPLIIHGNLFVLANDTQKSNDLDDVFFNSPNVNLTTETGNKQGHKVYFTSLQWTA